MRTAEKLNVLERELLTLAKKHKWQLEAWAVFVNHYHFVARGDGKATALGKFLKHLHSNSARQVNELDDSAGRKVWHNYISVVKSSESTTHPLPRGGTDFMPLGE